MTESFQSSIYLAIAACLAVLLVVLRDFRLSILTIAPVVAVSLWLNAGMNLFWRKPQSGYATSGLTRYWFRDLILRFM